MSFNDIQQCIDQYTYKEAHAKKLECNYFADEITLVYEHNDEFDICCVFEGCCNVNFDHHKSSNKWGPVKTMTYGQIPYFMFDIIVGGIIYEGVNFYTCDIDMGLLKLEIWCSNITVNKVKIMNTSGGCSEFKIETN